MDRATIPAPPENEIAFLLSLLHISAPGQPVLPQSAAIKQLLSAANSR